MSSHRDSLILKNIMCLTYMLDMTIHDISSGNIANKDSVQLGTVTDIVHKQKRKRGPGNVVLR